MKRPSERTIQDLGENSLLQHLLACWQNPYGSEIKVGPGDDCAVLRLPGSTKDLLFKTDAMAEGVHFLPTTSPEWIGHKALARNLSDLAAMGGKPSSATVTLAMPGTMPLRRLERIYQGLEKLAHTHQVSLAGGEVIRAKQFILSIALIGWMPSRVHPVLRSTARPGDLIWVTGTLGGTLAQKHLCFEPRLQEGQWLARTRTASAMMDLSDGLGADLPRLAHASGLIPSIDIAKLPCTPGVSSQAALNDGEDYELLFTTSPSKGKALMKRWPFPSLPLTCLGQMLPAEKKAKLPSPLHMKAYGYDHFKQR